MILYYAIGGGLGHVTRARAVAETLGFGDRLAIVSASPAARDRRIIGEARSIEVPAELAGDPKGTGEWLRRIVESIEPEALYIDAFPAGILGELTDTLLPGDLPLYHVARLLRWEEYRRLLPANPLRFRACYVTEPLLSEHAAYLGDHADELLPLELRDPPAAPDPASLLLLEELRRSGARPIWLVVHSGPAPEIEELLAYADELAVMENAHPHILLLAPEPPGTMPRDAIHLDLYPASPLFPLADRIITGCGFNIMRQTLPWRDRHRFIPFPRRYDDQALRGARRRALRQETA